MTVTISDSAKEHSPTGDSDHAAYGQAHYWMCTCGQSSAFFRRQKKQQYHAEQHDKYCSGDVTIKARQ